MSKVRVKIENGYATWFDAEMDVADDSTAEKLVEVVTKVLADTATTLKKPHKE